MKSTKLDWRYIAGFFDGEGSVTRNASGWRISIPQTNHEVLLAIQRTSQVGNVAHVVKRKSHWRESWTFFISRQQDVYRFLQTIEPYLVVKRPIVRSVLRQLPIILQRQFQRRTRAQQRRQSVFRLRKQGYSYRAIGLKIGLDFGYVRRVFLRWNGK